MNKEVPAFNTKPSLVSTHETGSQGHEAKVTQFSSDKSIKSCRICLETGRIKNDAQHVWIKPCNCSGSLEYMHEECLIEWVNTMISRKLEREEIFQRIYCQICKEPLDLQIRQKAACMSKEETKFKIKAKKKTFFVHIGLLIFFGILMGTLAFFHKWHKSFTIPSQVVKILLICSWVTTSVGFTLWLIKLLLIFCVKKVFYVAKINQKAPANNTKLANHPQYAHHNKNQKQIRQSGVIPGDSKQNPQERNNKTQSGKELNPECV